MSPVRRLLLALVVPSLLAVAACSEATGPTQEQYAAMADRVCETTEEKLTELDAEYDAMKWDVASNGEENAYVDRPERWVRAKIVPQYERMASSLKGIPRPEGDATYLSDLYSDLDQRIEVLQIRPSDGRAVIEDDDQLRQRFASYGIEKCPGPKPGEGSEDEGQ